ncbi:MAG: GGDEF domain-containing protein, partial [Alphaproteobacteria bacterium]|nr:GGDEF domain-containing protein [Alphaproteobacteria bacterium]
PLMCSMVELSSNMSCMLKDGEITYVNAGGVNLMNAETPEQIVGMTLVDITGTTDIDKLSADVGKLIEFGTSMETKIICFDGTFKNAVMKAQKINNADTDVFSYILDIKDVTKEKQAEEKVRESGNADDITGLISRKIFEDRLERAIIRSTRASFGKPEHSALHIGIFSMNIDNLSHINESFGYEAGNQVLRTISMRLASSFRQKDTIARSESDGFYILLEDIMIDDDVELVARKTLALMYEPIIYEGNNLAMGCSIGISVFPKHGVSINPLIKASVTALKKVKENGGGYYLVYEHKMEEDEKESAA